MRARRAAAAAATAALLVTLAACSSEDDSTPEDSNVDTGTTPTADTAPSDEATSAADDDEDAGDEAASGPAEESGSHDPSEAPDDEAPTETAPTDEPSSDEQEPGGEDAQWISPGSSDQGEGDPAGGPLLAVDVRSGVHPYYDRVVIDLEGEGGNPGWYADYTGDPVEDGSGAPLEIDGNAFLHVTVSGFRMPEQGEEFAHGFEAVDGNGVTEAYVSSPFEGQIQVVLGVDSARPYRVFVLPDPMRLVIDIEIAG